MTGPRPPGQGEGRPPGQKGGPQAKQLRLHRSEVSVPHGGGDVATARRSDVGVYTRDRAERDARRLSIPELAQYRHGPAAVLYSPPGPAECGAGCRWCSSRWPSDWWRAS